MAMSGRIYTLSFQNVTISAAQDLFLAIAGASRYLGVHQFNIGQITGTTVFNARVRLRYLPATVTAGSGGSTPTPVRTNPNDAAATFTAHANDTTQASSSGTAVDLYDDVLNTVNGMSWFAPVPGRPVICGLSGAFVLSLDTALASFVTNASITIEEL